jgi:hypothetical protein
MSVTRGTFFSFSTSFSFTPFTTFNDESSSFASSAVPPARSEVLLCSSSPPLAQNSYVQGLEERAYKQVKAIKHYQVLAQHYIKLQLLQQLQQLERFPSSPSALSAYNSQADTPLSTSHLSQLA